MFGCEARALHQGVHDGLRDAARGVQKLFFDAHEVVERSLSLIVGDSMRDETARPGSLSAHSVNRAQ